jgi:MFS family permease
VFPALLYLLLLSLIPESPRWLVIKGRHEQALDVLTRVYGAAQAQESLQQIRRSLAAKSVSHGWRALFDRRIRLVMLIALGLAFFQQITGINAIFYYLPTIFAQAGGGVSDAFRQAVVVGLVNVVMTVVAIWLIDRLGRKPLLVIGVSGMALSLLTISWAFSQASYRVDERALQMAQSNGVPAELVVELRASGEASYASEAEIIAALESRHGAARVEPHRQALVGAALTMNARLVLIAIIGFVASFAISLGPVMWVLLSEIFPNEYRGVAISAAGFWNALVSASVTFVFPWELSTLGSAGTFLVYGLFASAALVFVLVFVRETKGRTLEELEGELLSPSKSTAA